MQRATGTVPDRSDSPERADMREAVTPYAAQLGAQSARARLASDLEPTEAGAASKMNEALTDVLNPLAGVLGGALGG